MSVVRVVWCPPPLPMQQRACHTVWACGAQADEVALDDLVNDLERFPLEPEDEGPEEEAPERAPEADAGDDGHGPPAGALDLNGDLDFEDEESDFGDDDLDLDLLLPDGSDTHTPVKAVSGTLVMSDESSDSELSAGGGGDPEEVDVSAAVDLEVNAVEVGGAEPEGVVSGREGAGAEAAEAAEAGPPLDTEAEPAGAIDLSLDTESEPEPRTEAATGLSLDTASEPELELAPALEPEAEPAGAIQLSLDTESVPELELAPALEPEADPAGAIQLSLDTEAVPEPRMEAATGLSQDTESEAELELSIAPAPEPDLAPEPEIRLDSVMDLAIDVEPEPAPEVETAAPPQPEPPARVNEARPQPATPPRAGSGRIRLGAMLALHDEPAPASPASAAADEELRALRAQLREKEAALKEQVAQMQEVMLRRSLSPPTASPVNGDGGGRSQTIIFALEQTVERLSLECKGHEARRKELQGQLAGAEQERERLAEAARGAQGAWARSKQDLRAVKGREQALQGQVSSLGGTVGRLEAQLRREKERYSRLVHQVNASRRGTNAALERSIAALHELKGQADAEHGRTLLSVKHDPDTYSAYLRLALPTEDNREEKAPWGEATTGVVTQAPEVAEADRAAPVGGAVAEDGAAAWGEEEKEPGCLDGVAAAIRGALGGVGGGGAAKVGSVSPQKAPRCAVDDALRGE